MNFTKRTTAYLWGFFLFSVLFFSCANPNMTEEKISEPDIYAHIEDAKARALLVQAMEAAGGWETWQNLSEISFDKHFILYDESGEIEAEVKQNFSQKNGTEKNNAEDSENSLSFQLGENLIEIGGDFNPDMEEMAKRNTVLSSTFVISIPFNLLDPGAKLSYAGKEKMESGQEVEVLQVVYDPEAHSNHSTPDTWWHFFDAKTYKHVAYLVQHADHYSLVENLSQTEAGGIVFPMTRKSWRSDPDHNKNWLRAEYEYSNFEVK